VRRYSFSLKHHRIVLEKCLLYSAFKLISLIPGFSAQNGGLGTAGGSRGGAASSPPLRLRLLVESNVGSAGARFPSAAVDENYSIEHRFSRPKDTTAAALQPRSPP